jgi:eukaryotic-like serine/threonine-protein kinase
MAQDQDREPVDGVTLGPADQDSLQTTGCASVSDDAPEATDGVIKQAGRYELREEISRGGMGAVHVALDRTLGRQVAVKLLLSRFEASSAVARRFVDEAHIAGQLQHPGIPPIHDLGTLPDGRPFLAMKLIKGRTLDELLHERTDPGTDRGRFIAVLEQVCQAVAYAHARRVIHRDLKPQNIMVGAFGEVQVMDWGLAKVLGETRTARVPTDSDLRVATEILSARDTDGSETQSGSVLGTPAYMAPEQAVGAIEQVDERSDVFGLGGVLAVILTGRPPYMSDSAESTRVLAARGKVEECFARLETCGAEPDLVELCKRCLSPEREDRPASAGEVAAAVANLRAESEERARQAELDRVRAEGDRARAEVEARAQRQKRRTQLAVALGIFGLMIVGGGAWLAVRSQAEGRRADADRVASVALGRADQLAAQAGTIDASAPAAADAVARLWEQAEAAIAQSDGAITRVGDAGLAARLREKGASVRSGLARARRDAALLAALEAADGADTGTIGGYSDRRASIRAYRSAFEAAGLPAGGDAATLAAAVVAERPGTRAALLRALERWAVFLQYPPDPDANRVSATIDLADPDPIPKEIRATVAGGDTQALAKLADRLGNDDLPPASAVLLGTALDEKGLVQKAVGILRSARDRAPSDLWLLACLSQCLRIGHPNDPVAIEESVGCARTLAAVNPTNAFSHYVLGQALHFGKNDPASAEPHYRKTLELNPGFAHCMINLGSIRSARGDLAGAEQWYRKAAETDPQFAVAHSSLANIWEKRGNLAGAEAEYRKLVTLEPKSSFYHNHLGWTLQLQGDLAGAEAEYREAIALDPSNRYPRENLAVVQRIAPLLSRLDDVLAGRTVPASPVEAANFALLCAQPFRRQYAAAARLYGQAFADDPKLPQDLANNPPLSHHYYAACCAAIAGSGQGFDAPADPAARAALRGQALAWLRAGLALRRKQAASDNSTDRAKAAQALDDWLTDSEDFGIRPGGVPRDLPAAEQTGWESLWSDVRATLANAQKPVPPTPTTTKP